MKILWCVTAPWLAAPDAVRQFCARAGIPTGDFFAHEDLVPHGAGRYLLLEGFRRLWPDRPLPPLAETPSGKPYFLGGQPAFSISHAGEIAVCAFGAAELGIDVEKIDSIDPSLLPVLQPEEKAYLRRLPEERQPSAFYQLWTQKESLLKAKGGVLADILWQESLITPEGRWKDRADGFWLRRIAFPDPAYAAAVSTREEAGISLLQLRLPESADLLSATPTAGKAYWADIR